MLKVFQVNHCVAIHALGGMVKMSGTTKVSHCNIIQCIYLPKQVQMKTVFSQTDTCSGDEAEIILGRNKTFIFIRVLA